MFLVEEEVSELYTWMKKQVENDRSHVDKMVRKMKKL